MAAPAAHLLEVLPRGIAAAASGVDDCGLFVPPRLAAVPHLVRLASVVVFDNFAHIAGRGRTALEASPSFWYVGDSLTLSPVDGRAFVPPADPADPADPTGPSALKSSPPASCRQPSSMLLNGVDDLQ